MYLVLLYAVSCVEWFMMICLMFTSQLPPFGQCNEGRPGCDSSSTISNDEENGSLQEKTIESWTHNLSTCLPSSIF